MSSWGQPAFARSPSSIEKTPYTFDVKGKIYRVDYEPAEI